MVLFYTSPATSSILGFNKPSSFIIDTRHPLSKGLVACWPLGDVVAGSCAQIAPNGGTSVNTGTIALAGSHHGGLASSFDGSTTYLTNTIKSFLSGSFSFSCWVSRNNGVDVNPMMAMTSNQATNYWAALQVTRTGALGNKPGFALFDGVHNPEVDGGTALTANTWYHLVGIRDVASGTIGLYVNGISQGTVVDSTTSVPTYSVFNIGSCSTFSTTLRDWVGLLEGARIYSRAITPSEITWLYREPYAGLVSVPSGYFVGTSTTAFKWWTVKNNYPVLGTGTY